MSQAGVVEGKSGVKFEIKLEEAKETPPKRQTTPPKERPLSQEIIEKKLKDAEERRQSLEVQKLSKATSYKERQQSCVQKVAEQSRSFSEETAAKQQERLEAMSEKKDANIKVIQERLREHEKHVEKVLECAKLGKIEKELKMKEKFESSLSNREKQLQQIIEKVREHNLHAEEVRKNKVTTQTSQEDESKES